MWTTRPWLKYESVLREKLNFGAKTQGLYAKHKRNNFLKRCQCDIIFWESLYLTRRDSKWDRQHNYNLDIIWKVQIIQWYAQVNSSW